MSILETIHGHQNLENLNAEQRKLLCTEIREFLVAHISKTGGHMSSNLGVVELTVALETVYNTAKDRLVFDVGHQSYVHKLLTGRQADFDSLRQFGGMAGFPKPIESASDSFVAGHASSSVSIALGMAKARKLNHQDYNVVCLMGDGAATGGMAYEGLCNAAVSGEPMVVVLNDNTLSIDQNVGGMASHLRQLRTKEHYLGMKASVRNTLFRVPGGRTVFRAMRAVKDKIHRMLIPTTIFESMGFCYLGPVDGHNTEQLINLLKVAKGMQKPVLLHVMTQKGKGYGPAEEHPKLFHGIGKFDPETGEPLKKSSRTFSDAFGEAMISLAAQKTEVCAITAAMPGGTGLLEFKNKFPDRLFDVGIAEEHAVSMAGGLAKQGAVPVVALYSTFLQRAYDMILQDICMLHQHVILAVDRAGLVGEDGETHHGVFDVGFLRQAPGLAVLCPASCKELQDMLMWAVLEQDGPIAIRYPRGGDGLYTESRWVGPDQSVVCHRKGDALTIITYGLMINRVMGAADILSRQGIETTVLRLLAAEPVDINQIVKNMSEKHRVFIAEEVSGHCGIKESIAWSLHHILPDCRIDGVDLGNRYIPHGAVDVLYQHYGLSSEALAAHIQEVLQHEN